jgi:hypothetical protein
MKFPEPYLISLQARGYVADAMVVLCLLGIFQLIEAVVAIIAWVL